MSVLVIILILAAIAGGIYWNRAHANKAMGGVQFTVGSPVADVVTAINATYCAGAKAAIKSTIGGVRLAPMGQETFEYVSRFGDVGQLQVSGSGNSATVSARTLRLHVGVAFKMRPRSGVYALSFAMTQRLFELLGIAPGAVKMLRFQNGLERALTRKLALGRPS